MKKHLRDPEPTTPRIEQLVNQVIQGDIKIPQFQRSFVWKRQDILSLCDSVYRGYPIGSILLWLTSQKLASERTIGDLEIENRPDEFPTYYLLDGQQRLSSLCGALFWNGKNEESKWNIYFDLEKEEFFYPKKSSEQLKICHFPMNKLLGTFDFINQCKKFENHPEKELYEKNAQRLLTSVKDYKVAAVTIGDMELNEVAPIFERINSTGRSLTIVDLMRAATWKEGFNLNDAMDKVKSRIEVRGFETVPDAEILKVISSCAGFGILKDDIDKLRNLDAKKLNQAIDKSIKSYELSIDFLSDEIGLPSEAYLPYSIQLTLLANFYNLNPAPNINKINQLKRWFWKSSIGAYYRTSSYSFTRSALDEIREFAVSENSHLDIGVNINIDDFLMDTFNLRKASSKTFALLLSRESPKNFMDASTISISEILALANKNEYHHIFPKNMLKQIGFCQEEINCHLNISILNLRNNRAISDKKPSEYFAIMQKQLGEHHLYEVLKSHYIDHQAYKAALSNDYAKFLEYRKAKISRVFQNMSLV